MQCRRDRCARRAPCCIPQGRLYPLFPHEFVKQHKPKQYVAEIDADTEQHPGQPDIVGGRPDLDGDEIGRHRLSGGLGPHGAWYTAGIHQHPARLTPGINSKPNSSCFPTTFASLDLMDGSAVKLNRKRMRLDSLASSRSIPLVAPASASSIGIRRRWSPIWGSATLRSSRATLTHSISRCESPSR